MNWSPGKTPASPKRWLLIAAVLVAALSIFAAAEAREIEHVGGVTIDGSPTVRLYDALAPGSPVLVRESEPYPARLASWTVVHDSMFVAAGSRVYRHDRSLPDLPCVGSWTSGEELLGLADGPERGLVLVLDRRALTMVRFPDMGLPTALWSQPLDLAGLPEQAGRLLLRRGNHVYVADPTLPGVRVLSIDSESGPTTIATYASPGGVVHDLTLWGTTLALLTGSTAAVVDIGSSESPEFTPLGSYETIQRAASAEVTSRHVFMADGANLLVLDLDPSNESFLGSPVASWVAPTEIRSVRLDRKGRAYILLADSWEILDVSALTAR
jgi:hypothetical protein